MMKCDICGEEAEQTFTMKDGAQLRLCRKDYDHLVANFQVTGKLVPRKCKACKSTIGYQWIPYKAPGRKRKSSVGNALLDTFYDMRSPLERVLGEKERKPRKKKGEEVTDASQHLDNVPTEEGQSVQPDLQTDATPPQ